MKKFWIVLCWSGAPLALATGQTLAAWSFENLTTAVPRLPIPASTLDFSLLYGRADLSGGNNIGSPGGCSGANTWATNFWPTSNYPSSGDYLSFEIKAKPGQALRLGGFSFAGGLSSSNGPQHFQITGDIDGESFALFGGDFYPGCGGNGAWFSIDVPPGGTATFFIHPYGQNPASMAATLRVDEVSIEGNTILPVELQHFRARAQRLGGVQVQWRTATETNNAYQELQRSVALPHFLPIVRFPGQGNREEPQNYTFTDWPPADAPVWYYRLRQVDTDSTETYSVTLAVANAAVASSWRFGPSGSPGYLRLENPNPGPSSTQVQVFNLEGQVLAQHALPAQTTLFDLPVAQLPAGIYGLRLQSGGNSTVLRWAKTTP